MVKFEEKIMKYSEICSEFDLEQKRGKSKELQLNQLRKDYSITLIEGTRKYKVRPLTDTEKKRKLVSSNISYRKTLEPMIIDILSRQGDAHLVASCLELQVILGLINTNFVDVSKCTELATELANIIGTDVSNLSKFKREVYNINKVTLDNIFKDLYKKKIIVCKTVMIVVKNNDRVILTNEEESEIVDFMNEESHKYNYTNYYKITDESVRKKITEAVNLHFGITSKYYAYDMYLHENSLRSYLEDFKGYKSHSNLLTQIKIEKSTRGDLKYLTTLDKLNMIKELISIE